MTADRVTLSVTDHLKNVILETTRHHGKILDFRYRLASLFACYTVMH